MRQYHIEVSSRKMRAARISLEEVMTAVSQSNLNVGGKVIEENGMEFGLFRSLRFPARRENFFIRSPSPRPLP